MDVSVTGLAAVCDGQVEILTGIHSGSVHVTVSSHHHPPARDPGPWEEISELSFPSPSGTLVVAALMHDLDEELPPLTTAGPGTYRLRIHTVVSGAVSVDWAEHGRALPTRDCSADLLDDHQSITREGTPIAFHPRPIHRS
ncbi:hypothetical protein ACIQXD_33155 [Streptomyces uncialis]|uniref:hypothetical protein n=1 Tax=Streptomyces uncialis TaxID=1048205 RepID=UPI003827C44B